MSQTANVLNIHRLVWVSLMAALTGIGALVAVPLGPVSPVPVTLQTMFVLLAGLVLGPRGGVIAMLLYMAAGIMGLPVFSGGKSGLAVFAGPTGGFLISFILMAFMAGLARGLGFGHILAACLAASAANLFFGCIQLMLLLDVTPARAIAIGVTPFLPGGLAKCLAAAGIYRFMARRRLLPI